jgi:hypothetical protein
MINPITILLDWLRKQWIFSLGGFIAGILTFIWQIISNPLGAINQFFIHVIDVFLLILPSTPETLKFGSLLSGFDSNFPMIGSGVLVQIIEGITGIFLIFLLLKLIKLLPFI